VRILLIIWMPVVALSGRGGVRKKLRIDLIDGRLGLAGAHRARLAPAPGSQLGHILDGIL